MQQKHTQKKTNSRFSCDVYVLARTKMCCIQRSAFTRTRQNKEINIQNFSLVYKSRSIFLPIPGLMMALSDTLKTVTFCLGGTPAFLNISIVSSDLCRSLWWEGGKKKTKQNRDWWKVAGEVGAVSNSWTIKIYHHPVTTVREPKRHTRKETQAVLAARVSLTFAFAPLTLKLSASDHSRTLPLPFC